MVIIVCLKQVLNKSYEGISKNVDGVNREEYELVNNPNDLYAVEEGLRLREKYGGTVSCISMGPEKCWKNLREVLSLGVDQVVLLSDKHFVGSDTLATAYTIAAGIRKMGSFDVILSGEQSLDGETGQVGPSLAEQLNISHVMNISELCNVNQFMDIVVKKEVEDGEVIMKFKLPCLLGIKSHINEVRIPTVFGMIRANEASISVCTSSELDIDIKKVGIRGSPTKVLELYEPEGNVRKKAAEIFVFKDNKNCIPYILSKLVKV